MSYAPVRSFKTEIEAIAYIQGWKDADSINEKFDWQIFREGDLFEVNVD